MNDKSSIDGNHHYHIALTKRQRDAISDLVLRSASLMFSTEAVQPDQARSAVYQVYKAIQQPPPREIKIAPSPYFHHRAESLGLQAAIGDKLVSDIRQHNAILYNRLTGESYAFVSNTVNSILLSHTTGRHLTNTLLRRTNFQHVSYTTPLSPFNFATIHQFIMSLIYVRVLKGNNRVDLVNAFDQLASGSAGILPQSHTCWLVENPLSYAFDDRRTLHASDGPAVEWRDGAKQYFLHGENVGSNVIENPQSVNLAEIVDASPARRRIIIDHVGLAHIFSGAPNQWIFILDRTQWGSLYLFTLTDDEPLCVVEVRNATPEADGSFSTHFLRVPPHIRTARAAVAWTFGELWHSYHPVIES